MTVHLLDAERSGQSKKLHRSPRETARGHQSCEADAWIAAQAEVRRNLACTTTEARASRRDIRYRSYVRLWRPFRCGRVKRHWVGSFMGLGPPVIELYRQLKLQGALEGITEVMELGSQDFWCPQKNLVTALVKAFGKTVVDPALLDTSNASQKPARLLYEALGIRYGCVDVDGRVGSVVMDLNFDPVPDVHKGKYGLVTNHGTSEHILNQYNVFKAMHEFARPGGVFVHAVPFTVHLEHGFFNYQPNFFEALARYNSYETLGIW